MRTLHRFLIYAMLLLGSITFLIPLLWMFSTALKPIDQTMTMPPSWVPYKFFVEHRGVRIEVTRGELIEAPACVAQIGGQRRIVPLASVVSGQLTQTLPNGEQESVPVKVLQEIPADRQHAWITVTPVAVTNAAWEVLPASSVIREVAPRWENFTNAITAMKEFPRYERNTLVLCVL